MIDNKKYNIICHIPHSSTFIPSIAWKRYLDSDMLMNEINLLTDWKTDEIFKFNNTQTIIFPYSRVFCDVERLDDENEPMYKFGRGFFYTKTDSGKDLISTEYMFKKDYIYNKYYKPHHSNLEKIVDISLSSNKVPLIIDCHSFNDIPLQTDLIKTPNRPDFCIGTDNIHTPSWLLDEFYILLNSKGYSVEINTPYSGTIVPLKYYTNPNVLSIMIEVNKKIYMDGNKIKQDVIIELNEMFATIFKY